ncbi:Trm112 family protein [Trichlorobacter ammonificans]|uniref:UPF0434 protein GEAMG1_0680 n=1 Tax=Trichlorobacter ammonificans TaxID=2916410 RepID=A0ABM9D5L6_9BACT|nr:Trm112 family protein [Trichlorobacter ammonificans]CAH2030492.1 conserved protein of unknown function [Trichlorobacter ammonificans]
MDSTLLNILACPACNGPLEQAGNNQGLLCRTCGLLFPMIDDIPVLLLEEAERLQETEP